MAKGEEFGDVEVLSIGDLMKNQRVLTERRRKEKQELEPQGTTSIMHEAPLDILSEIEGEIESFEPWQVKEALCR